MWTSFKTDLWLYPCYTLEHEYLFSQFIITLKTLATLCMHYCELVTSVWNRKATTYNITTLYNHCIKWFSIWKGNQAHFVKFINSLQITFLI